MLLSVFVASHYISTVVFDPSASKFSDQKLIKIPFNADNTYPGVSKDILAKLLSENIAEYGKYDLVTTIDLKQTYDLAENYSLADVSSKIPFVIAVLNHYESNLYQKLAETSAAEYLNSRKYRTSVSFETKKKLDGFEIEHIMPAILGSLIDLKSVVFSTVEVPEPDQKEYLRSLIKAFTRVVPIAGIWRFSLDANFDIVPRVSALIYSETSIKDYLGFDESYANAVLVSAPGVVEVEISITEKEKNKVVLEPNKINEIRLGEGETANFRWKSLRSRYKGPISGSSLGILFDNRELNAKN